MSWRSPARRSTRSSAGVASAVAIECSNTSCATALSCGIVFAISSSGKNTSSSPRSLSIRNATDGFGAERIFTISCWIRSPDSVFASGADSRIASAVRGSMVKPSSVANRTARSIRRASSVKRSRASPTARMMRASRSRRPPNGSTSSPALPPAGGRQAIAFMVKSRRERSSWSESVNATDVGWR